MSNTNSDDHIEDPLARIVRMTHTGEVSNITVQMLDEARAYLVEKERKLKESAEAKESSQ